MTKSQLKTSAFFCLKGKINFKVGEKRREGKGEKKKRRKGYREKDIERVKKKAS